MSDLKPLIDAAAFWVTTDANLRIGWSIFGAVLLLLASAAVATLIGVAIRRLKAKP